MIPPGPVPDGASRFWSRGRYHPWRADLIASAALAAIAAALRLALVFVSPPIQPVADMADYWERALYIFQHGALYPSSLRMPGYPAGLALAFAIASGPSLTAARIFNVAAGVAASLLTYWFARRTAGVRASAAAALVVAFYPTFLIYTTLIPTEILVPVPLVAALVASTYRGPWAAAVAGACAGLATLVRPAAIALLPAVCVATARVAWSERRRRDALLAPLVAAVACALTMAPWWIHNARLYGRFVPLDTTGGATLAIGNNELASGIYRWRETGEMIARHLPGVELNTPDGSDRLTGVAVRFVREHPAAAIRLVPLRLGALFGVEGREHAWLYSFGFFGQRDPATVRLWALAIMVSFPLLLIAALLGWSVRGGLATPVRDAALLTLAFTVAMHAISIGDPRFHVPLVPIFAVLATGLAKMRNGFSKVRLAAAAIGVTLLAVAWAAQLAIYWAALAKLAPAGGWMTQIPYDDLL